DLEEPVRVLLHLSHPIALGVLVAPHHREHLGLELAPRLDVDVDVGDAARRRRRAGHGAQKLPYDNCAFNRTWRARLRRRVGATRGVAQPRQARASPPGTKRGWRAAGRCETCAPSRGNRQTFDTPGGYP